MRYCFAVCAVASLGLAANSRAALLQENFEDVSSLAGKGWVMINNSVPLPTGISAWEQGNSVNQQFYAQSGTADSYLISDYSRVENQGTISAWLLSPVQTFTRGDTITFYTRTLGGSIYADRLQVLLSNQGHSVNVGTTETSVGDFTTVLLDINPTYIANDVGQYPTSWTKETISLAGLSGDVTGRLAFRYFVEDGGLNGSRSNLVALDSLAVPEPVSGGMILMASGGLLIRRRR